MRSIAKTMHALQYAKTIRAEQTLAVHIEDDHMKTLELQTAWATAGLGDVPLKILRVTGDEATVWRDSSVGSRTTTTSTC